MKGNIIKFITAFLITNQSFGMIHQFHLSILLITFLSCLLPVFYKAHKFSIISWDK